MRFILIIMLFNLISCSSPSDSPELSECLNKMDTIAVNETFREAIYQGEKCLKKFDKNTKLNLKLAEYYLLTYLVDNKKYDLDKAQILFSKALNIDTTFRTNHSDFKLEKTKLHKFREVWFSIPKDKYEKDRERILIWALIDKFNDEKEPKLIKRET